jgi:hypothetical protein
MRLRFWRRRNPADSAGGYRPGLLAVREQLVQALQTCPICGGGFAGHRIALVATTALGERQRGQIERIFEALELRRPERLLEIQDWNPAGSNAEVYALACTDGLLAAVVASTGPAPPHLEAVTRCQSLGTEASRELTARIAPDRWEPLGD